MLSLSLQRNAEPFANLLKVWPWPCDSKIEGVEPFRFSLDGGGRHLMQTIFDSRPEVFFAEFGTFMGGASREWLATNPGLKCMCVDPWGEDITEYVKHLSGVDWAVKAYGRDKLVSYADLLSRYGPMRVVRNNLVEFKDRCILLRGRIPAAFAEMKLAGAGPDLVFIDALKKREDFVETHKAFPDAIIAGDDWSWGKSEDGTYPIRPFVEEIARARGAVVYADRATFVISEPRHELCFDKQFRYDM